MSAEEFIAPGRAETADDINPKIGIPECSSQVVEEVEYPGIVLMNFTGAVIAQKTVQACHRFPIVAFTVAVNDVQSLSSMCMKEMQAVGTVRNTQHS